ncbi:GntR family transcriptional regulator [Agrobacterium sp. a22-2]|uniref:GntR family transcriptional regulator n=1 Tax=Agrobacterium sp. a22-2 TaxID=2283840 RepID=UPI0014465D55|nr:GntR family transcriptional regulator [Agrobacterium sp. a22-2]NKN39268.1 GntR family transcriptional regulator [Agrobacterium sp. a22-2]
MNVRNLSLVESVYADLRLKLQLSEIGPDDRLVDTEIAEIYGTSRMPAREALLRLVAEGYLVGSTRGFMVPVLSRDDIVGLFELRRQLEPRAAAAAARDLTPQAEADLLAAMNAIRQGNERDDIALMIRGNVAFRSAWIAAVRNPHMAATISRFIDYFQGLRIETFADTETRGDYIATLGGLFEAFRARDPLLAQDRMMAFMFAAEAAYLAARDRQIEQGQAAKSRRSKKNTRQE